MKKNVGWLVICMLLLAGPVIALFCNQCGKDIPEKSRFCSFCGASQKIPALSPRWGVCPPKAMDGVSLGGPSDFSQVNQIPPQGPSTVPKAQAGHSPMVLKSGGMDRQEFLGLFQKLDREEETLKLSFIATPNCRNFIQGRLNPGIDRIRNYVVKRGVKLDANQYKLLSLYKSLYSAILESTVSLGYRKAVANENVMQLAVLKHYLRNHFDDANQEYYGRIEKNFADELKNIYGRIVNLDSRAGFENPGVCYQVRKDGLVSNGKGVSFTFRMNTSERKVGDQISVIDANRKEVAKLILKGKEEDTRVYECFLPFGNISEKKCRSLYLEIPCKSQFKAWWQKQKVEFVLVPPLEKDSGTDFYLEATYGFDPGTSRKNYLSGLGLY